MATAYVPFPTLRDDRFFLIMAIIMALTNIAGFSLQLAMGRSTFAAPWTVHAHAVIFFGWTFFYVVQSALVAGGSVALHRRLGWIGAGWAAAVVLVGVATTVMMVRRGTTPFFFQPVFFLFMNCLTALFFGALVTVAIWLRRRSDWHRRLLLCAMAMLTGPAFGRLLPMPLMIPWAAWGVFLAIMLFPLAGMIADQRRRGLVHPAWWWGTGTMLAVQMAMGALAFSGPGLALYDVITRDTPGAARPPLEFPPFPGR